MAVVQTLIGNVKGPQGETGATGATGAKGDAATITVGSVSTTAYGNAARVENVGTENDAILNFTIPQGAPGQRTTTMSGLTLDTVTTSAEEFPVPAVGENGATVWGKVIKWFADGLAAIRSKLDANKVVNSQTVTEAGYALDAQQANPNVSGSLAAQISELNDSLTNLNANKGYVKNINITVGANSTENFPISSLFDSEGLYLISFVDNTGLAVQNAPIAIVRVYNGINNLVTYFSAKGQSYWGGAITIENPSGTTAPNLIIKNTSTSTAWTATKMSLKPLEVR